MGDVIKFDLQVELESIEFAGCGHIAYVSKFLLDQKRQNHDHFFCFACGRSNWFPPPKKAEPLPPPPKKSTIAKIIHLVKPT